MGWARGTQLGISAAILPPDINNDWRPFIRSAGQDAPLLGTGIPREC